MAAILAVLFFAVVIAVDWISGEASSATNATENELTGPDPTRRSIAGC